MSFVCEFAPIDFLALADQEQIDLRAAFSQLRALYDEVDARNVRNTQNLALPCHRGCDMCCHESVFLTPLEFFYAWDWAQRHLPADVRHQIILAGLRLYHQHAALIDAMEAKPPEGASDHFALARQIRFTCPFLGSDGACQIYPARELLARLFGCSFNDDQGIYGCHLVAAHLADKTVTLMPARPTARRLETLPLTFKRQVYPYYFHLFFGQQARAQGWQPGEND